jgi:glycosyltransferase involved in cell wall biosynthesis
MEIRYYYQENQGKHIAINRAVEMTESELFVIADSDDAFTPEALEKLVAAWDSIPTAEKMEFKGVICRCFDSESGEAIGEFPYSTFDSNDLDGNFKFGLNFEKWMLFRTDVLREFPFPGDGEGLKFFPETVIWQSMARKYKTRYIDAPLREYFRDQENALTHKKTPRFRENTYLWAHRVNNTMDYFWYDPFAFLKAFVGLCRDNIIIGRSFEEIIKIPNRWWKRFLCVFAYPVGWVLSKGYSVQVGGRRG